MNNKQKPQTPLHITARCVLPLRVSRAPGSFLRRVVVAGLVLALGEGKVMMAWFGGTYEGAEDVAIWTAIQEDGVWGAPLRTAKVHRDVAYRG